MRKRIATYLADPEIKKRIHISSGFLAESLAPRILELEGFKKEPSYRGCPNVILIEHIRKGRLRRKERLKDFFQDYLKKGYWKKCDGLPDLMAVKGKEIYAIEVKSGNSHLKVGQAKVLEMAEKHGLKPYILRIKMSIEVKEVNFVRMSFHPKRNVPIRNTSLP